MCAPIAAIAPILGAVGTAATVASQLGILGGNRARQSTAPQQRSVTPPPSTQAPTQAASGAGEDEMIKPESIEVTQNAKQKRDKQTVKKGTGQLGALPGINTGVTSDASPTGVVGP